MTGNPAEVLPADLAGPPATREGHAGPAAGTEAILAGILADVMHVERAPADANFFGDLGADSLVMAHFCARVRKREDLPPVSMKDIYAHPTIASLAAALADAPPDGAAPAPGRPPAPAPAEEAARASTRQYVLCGTLQLLTFFGFAYTVAVFTVRVYGWIYTSPSLTGVYLGALFASGAAFAAACTLPVAVKWVLIGRWKPQQIQIWSLAYFRFWVVRMLVRSNPLAFMFAGTPLYALYLRALGARIGPRVVILSRHVPVCTDLLTIGAGTVIRKDAFFQCYRAQAGWIQAGPVTLGREVFVGEKSVLDINTSMGDGTQLGHASALHSGQAIPAGQRWHGSPAQPAEVNYLTVAPTCCGPLRRARFCALSLAALLFVYLPLAQGGLYMLLDTVPSLVRPLLSDSRSLSTLLNPATGALVTRRFYADALFFSVMFFCGAVLAGLLLIVTVPRVLRLFITPGKTYPLYGARFALQRLVSGLTNVRFFRYLFGDSSAIVYYLQALGYRLAPVEQTGSNFGCEVAHESPYLSSVGSGTMVADGLAMLNADFSATSFRISEVSIGPHNFVGNDIVYPAGGRTGENCLLATKAMVPLDGPVREGVGLLGSPPFEIPRSVERDSRFDHLRAGEEFRRRLRAKNNYNLRTMGVFLAAWWGHVFLLTVLGLAAFNAYGGFAGLPMAGFFALTVLVTLAYFVLVERVLWRFRPMQPRFCSIYDRYFWRIERYWKVAVTLDPYLHALDGTPFKTLIWRALGVRIGKRVFDDGCSLTERTPVAIGDGCVLNAGSEIQCHSQEDGTFKADRSTLGAGCTLGVGALVHYGVTMGDGSVLAADSFLMKGEEVPAGARWGGNPAREISQDRSQPA